MIISREEAVGLFNKGKTESTPLAGLLVGGVMVRFFGVITELSSSGLVVSQSLSSGRQAVEVMIGFRTVKSYDYKDPSKDASEIQPTFAGEVASVLEMTFAASTVWLYEKARD